MEEFAVGILDLIAQRPDLTLVETVAELRKRRIKTSRRARFGITTVEYSGPRNGVGLGANSSLPASTARLDFAAAADIRD